MNEATIKLPILSMLSEDGNLSVEIAKELYEWVMEETPRDNVTTLTPVN